MRTSRSKGWGYPMRYSGALAPPRSRISRAAGSRNRTRRRRARWIAGKCRSATRASCLSRPSFVSNSLQMTSNSSCDLFPSARSWSISASVAFLSKRSSVTRLTVVRVSDSLNICYFPGIDAPTDLGSLEVAGPWRWRQFSQEAKGKTNSLAGRKHSKSCDDRGPARCPRTRNLGSERGGASKVHLVDEDPMRREHDRKGQSLVGHEQRQSLASAAANARFGAGGILDAAG